MNWSSFLDARPIVIAIAGSNGSGKTTFFRSHLANSGLQFINADDLAEEFKLEAYQAADFAASIRKTLIYQRKSFIFETVLSDPIGEKVSDLVKASQWEISVVLIFIRIDSVEISKERVSIRVSQSGHDVPDEKLEMRFERTKANLSRAIESLPLVIVFNNSDLSLPFQLEVIYQNGKPVHRNPKFANRVGLSLEENESESIGI